MLAVRFFSGWMDHSLSFDGKGGPAPAHTDAAINSHGACGTISSFGRFAAWRDTGFEAEGSRFEPSPAHSDAEPRLVWHFFGRCCPPQKVFYGTSGSISSAGWFAAWEKNQPPKPKIPGSSLRQFTVMHCLGLCRILLAQAVQDAQLARWPNG